MKQARIMLSSSWLNNIKNNCLKRVEIDRQLCNNYVFPVQNFLIGRLCSNFDVKKNYFQ